MCKSVKIMRIRFRLADSGEMGNLVAGPLLVFLLLCLISAELSIRQPARRICGMAVVDTINKQQ